MDDTGLSRENKSYSFFANTSCEYFPCHENVPSADFNCLFCFCPLYFLGNNCGGDFSRLPNGVKDCSQCIIPHRRENYERIIARLEEAIMHVWDS